MPEDNVCKNCKIEMELLREDNINGTIYKILKCKKCKHQIARADS